MPPQRSSAWSQAAAWYVLLLTQANLPYMLWNAAFNALFIFSFTALHDTFQHLQLGRADDVPLLFQQINDHSLWIFLLVRRVSDPGQCRNRAREPRYPYDALRHARRDARPRRIHGADAGRGAQRVGALAIRLVST